MGRCLNKNPSYKMDKMVPEWLEEKIRTDERKKVIDEFVDKLFYIPGIDDWESVLDIAGQMKGDKE